MQRRVWTVLFAVGLMLSGLVTPALAGDGFTDSSGFNQNRATFGCAVQPPGWRGLGDKTVLRHCGKVDKRQWRYNTVGKTRDGYRIVQIKNKYSGYCLGVGNKKAGTRVTNTYCVHPTGGRPASTKWKVWSDIDVGYLTFKNRLSNKCIGITKKTSTGRKMAQRWCDGSRYGQLWGGSWGTVGVS